MVRYAQAQRIASRVIDGKAVVIVIDQQQLHTLNEVGTFLWQALDPKKGEPKDVDALVHHVVESFDVSEAQARSDVQDFLGTLVGMGALQEVNA